MRLLTTFDQEASALQFSAYLTKQSIDHYLETEATKTDLLYRLWITNEDSLDQAKEALLDFQQNPLNNKFVQKTTSSDNKSFDFPKERSASFFNAPLTYSLVLICCGLLFLSYLTSQKDDELPQNYIFTSPIYEKLLYDFPYSYTLLNQLIKEYGIKALQAPDQLPQQGQVIARKLENTPTFDGYYNRLIASLKHEPPPKEGEKFEKIKEGEVWRIFSPIILHGDIFHLFFNMLWLIVIGCEMEKRMKISRYILFILLTAAITNTAQYLITGPRFVGFSGVLLAMVTYVWMRQKKAPWEGYNLQPSTWRLLVLFIGLMVAIQFVSFILEVTTTLNIPIQIANTAHLTGALCGYIFSKWAFFYRKKEFRH